MSDDGVGVQLNDCEIAVARSRFVRDGKQRTAMRLSEIEARAN